MFSEPKPQRPPGCPPDIEPSPELTFGGHSLLGARETGETSGNGFGGVCASLCRDGGAEGEGRAGEGEGEGETEAEGGSKACGGVGSGAGAKES